MIKQVIRKLLLEILILLSRMTQCRKRLGIPIFVFHSIDTSGSPLSIAPETFDQQVAYLEKKGFQLISATDAIKRLQANKQNHRCVVFTFDDAYTTIAPSINKLANQGHHITLFVPIGLTNETNRWDIQKEPLPQLPIMSNETLKTLPCELGAHTRTHPHLPDLTDAQLMAELDGARKDFTDQINKPTDILAYPFGEYTPRVIEATKHAGYTAAFTTKPGYLSQTTPLFEIPRFPSNWDHLQFRMVVHGAYPWYRTLQDRLFGAP